MGGDGSTKSRIEPYSDNRELMDMIMDESKEDAEQIDILCTEALGLETNEVARWTVFRHLEAIQRRAQEVVKRLT